MVVTGVGGSALCGAYRDRVRAAAPGVVVVHLTGDRELIEERPARRQGHFTRRVLPHSRLAEPGPLEPGEAGVTVEVSGPPEEVTDRVTAAPRGLRDSAVAR
ncbi:hypothetical protein SHKM778_42500 [Streptomyces sp. KM77-8]|uniref:Gluconokinase n=1 Tax=Streptomyces haneummycinicus TaxID=3074435 RepID=A0AAT9HKC0_9ACTN